MTGSQLVVLAGFRADLLAALQECGSGVELGDRSPFTEWLPGVELRQLDLLGQLAGGEPGRLVAAAVREHGGFVVREAPLGWVRALAGVDDLALGRLRDRWWAQLHGADSSLAGGLAESLRGVIVQCRAAVLNGWQMLVVQSAAVA